MNHNWYIGQDIVCIKTAVSGLVKEGEIFTIKGLQTSFCLCNEVEINVGVKHERPYVRCGDCGVIVASKSLDLFFSESLFAPLDTLTDISEIEEILNQPFEELFKIK
jgi:hypothetical protein